MRTSLRRWLAAPSFTNPIEQGQSPVVQIMLLGILVTAILVFPICYSAGVTAIGKLITSAADGIVILTTPLALVAFRRGAFRAAIVLEAAACLVAISLFFVPLGLHQSWALLAFPVPITEAILVAPLIGVLDRDRITVLIEKLLEGVQQRRAHTVILDITGVPGLDGPSAQALLEVGAAVRLLGAAVSIVGIRADVAQAIVRQGLELGDLQTFGNLQGALAALDNHRPLVR
jgi:anti-anti-sigma regulatory factor